MKTQPFKLISTGRKDFRLGKVGAKKIKLGMRMVNINIKLVFSQQIIELLTPPNHSLGQSPKKCLLWHLSIIAQPGGNAL